jgi:hypothetical protein
MEKKDVPFPKDCPNREARLPTNDRILKCVDPNKSLAFVGMVQNFQEKKGGDKNMSVRTCHYCEVWTEVPKKLRLAGRESDGSGHSRYCLHTKKWMRSNNEACIKFKPASHFWCDNIGCRMHMTVCLRRFEVGYDPDCKDCRQVSTVKACRRGHRPRKKTGIIRRRIGAI